MKFDLKAARARIEGKGHPAPCYGATRATRATQGPEIAAYVAQVARVACSTTPEPECLAPPQSCVEMFPHGSGVGGRPLTWTGRVVSLDAWRSMSEWERHGPQGRHWNGISLQWEDGGQAQP